MVVLVAEKGACMSVKNYEVKIKDPVAMIKVPDGSEFTLSVISQFFGELVEQFGERKVMFVTTTDPEKLVRVRKIIVVFEF